MDSEFQKQGSFSEVILPNLLVAEKKARAVTLVTVGKTLSVSLSVLLPVGAWMAHGALSRRLLHLRCIAPGEVGPESGKAFALVERAQRECAA